MSAKKTDALCPCGSGKYFAGCCGSYIEKSMPAPTAEALMRSRYTAYVRKDQSYLMQTWHASTRPKDLNLENNIKWVSLEIITTKDGRVGDQAGEVEFIARYKINGKAEKLHETSRFVNEEGQWFYISGDAR